MCTLTVRLGHRAFCWLVFILHELFPRQTVDSVVLLQLYGVQNMHQKNVVFFPKCYTIFLCLNLGLKVLIPHSIFFDVVLYSQKLSSTTCIHWWSRFARIIRVCNYLPRHWRCPFIYIYTARELAKKRHSNKTLWLTETATNLSETTTPEHCHVRVDLRISTQFLISGFDF